jgi:hypothetical protein
MKAMVMGFKISGGASHGHAQEMARPETDRAIPVPKDKQDIAYLYGYKWKRYF